jgi:hypothetical protein
MGESVGAWLDWEITSTRVLSCSMSDMAEVDLGMNVVHRCVNSLSLAVVNMLGNMTTSVLSPLESICFAGLSFVLVGFVLDCNSIHLRLIKRVCLLYCNQCARLFFSMDSGTGMGLFSNLLLVEALAVLLLLVGDHGPGGDLRAIFQGMLYLYGDILDFSFQYGVFKITLFAFMVGLYLDNMSEPENPVYAFSFQLFKVISANLTSEGLNSLIESTPQLELFECLVCVSLLRSLFPSMGSYFIYMAARRVFVLFPDLTPLLFFALLWVDFLPVTCRGWVGELCCIYIVTSVASFLITMTPGGVIVVLVLAHYMDVALQMYIQSKKQ